MVLRRILTCCDRLLQNGVTAQNGEQQIRLPNGLLYGRVEVEQRTHSWDKIGLLHYNYRVPAKDHG